MRKLHLICITLLTALLSLTACDDEEAICPVDSKTVDATLHWTGEYAIDGCGYILKIGEVDHKPENEEDIPDSFKVFSPTAVEVRYLDYEKTVRACMAGVAMQSIKIEELRRR